MTFHSIHPNPKFVILLLYSFLTVLSNRDFNKCHTYQFTLYFLTNHFVHYRDTSPNKQLHLSLYDYTDIHSLSVCFFMYFVFFAFTGL